MLSRFLFIALVALLLACAQETSQDQGASTPVSPLQPTAAPLATSTVQPAATPEPAVTSAPLPTPTPLAVTGRTPAPAPTVDIADFALACAEVNSQDESALGWTFEGWVEEAQAIDPPPALTDWWGAYVGQFALQLTSDGPNEHSQEAADDERRALVSMDPGTRDYLVDTGCVTAAEVQVAIAVDEAWGRLLGGYGQGRDVSVEEFADACKDIKLTAPTMQGLAALPLHMAHWWVRLTPPPELVVYHLAIAMFYEDWVEGSGDDPADSMSSETQAYLNTAMQAMDADVLEILLARGCAG